MLLRIEDHDRGRCRREYELALLDDLDWLGLVPDGASTDAFRSGPHPQRQSDDPARYAARLTALEARQLAYPCICSRTEIERSVTAPAGSDGSHDVGADSDADGSELRYPGTCRKRDVDPTSTTARRVRMESDAETFDDARLGPQTHDPSMQSGDLLVRDRDGNFTYQFAVVVDDLEQPVDVVIRGEDLLSSTARQIQLARLLGRPVAPRFAHHPLVRNAEGRKLSKSAGDSGVRELRAAGQTPHDVLGAAAFAAGLAPSVRRLDASDLAGLFT